MEKVIQEHLNTLIFEFNLIAHNVITKSRFGGSSENDYFKFFEFLFPSKQFNYYIEVDKKYSMEQISLKEPESLRRVVEFKQNHGIDGIRLGAKNIDILWNNEGLLKSKFIRNDNIRRYISYRSNKINYITFNNFIVIYDLEKYLEYDEEKYFKHYTYEDIERILKGDLKLASGKRNIAYIGEDRKIVIAGCNHKFHEYSECSLGDYLKSRKNELIIELENLREDPDHYNSQLIGVLSNQFLFG